MVKHKYGTFNVGDGFLPHLVYCFSMPLSSVNNIFASMAINVQVNCIIIYKV